MTSQHNTNSSTESFDDHLIIPPQSHYQTISNAPSCSKASQASMADSSYSSFRYKNCMSIIVLLSTGYYYLIKQIASDIPKAQPISFILISILLSVSAISLLLYNNFWNTSADIKYILVNYYQSNYIYANLLLSLALVIRSVALKSHYSLIVCFGSSVVALYFYYQVYQALQCNQRRNSLFTYMIIYIAFDSPISLLLGWSIVFMIECYLNVMSSFLLVDYLVVVVFIVLTSVAIVNMTYCKDVLFSGIIWFYQCNMLIRCGKSWLRINCLLTLFTMLSIAWSVIANVKEKRDKESKQEEQNDAIKREYYDQES